MRTQVAIVGAGPAGLLRGHLLRADGSKRVVLERQTPQYVLSRIRVRALEQITVEVIERLGLAGRLNAEGLPDAGFKLAYGEHQIRIDLAELTGKHVVICGETELMRDLMDAASEGGLEVVHGAENVTLHDTAGNEPHVTYRRRGANHRLEPRFVRCDGFHGRSRQAIPTSMAREFGRIYPFDWLGILADVAPCNDELIYANHQRGFALASMRSETRSNLPRAIADERSGLSSRALGKWRPSWAANMVVASLRVG